MSSSISNLEIGLTPVGSGVFTSATYAGMVVPGYRCPSSGATQVVVESPQSVANLLEARLWNAAEQRPVAELEGVPYLAILDGKGAYALSSRDTPHRVASGHFAVRLSKAEKAAIVGGGCDVFAAYADPVSALFGYWFSQWGAGEALTSRAARCFVGRIIASNASPVPRGGVQRDMVGERAHEDLKLAGDEKPSSLGLGQVPHGDEKADQMVAEAVTLHLSKIGTRVDALRRLPGVGNEVAELVDAAYEFAVADLITSGLMDLRTEAVFEIHGDADRHVASARLRSAADAYLAARENGRQYVSAEMLAVLDSKTAADFGAVIL